MKIQPRILIPAVIGVLAIAVISFLVFGSEDPVEKKFKQLREKPINVRDISDADLKLKMKDLGEGALVYEGELTFEQIVGLLRKKYGAHIKHGYVQISMITELIAYLKKKYPDSWVERLQEILGAAFPGLAADLFKTSENLYKFNKYLEDHQDKLSKMSPEDGRKELWAQRYAIFGDKADEIFIGVKRSEMVTDSLRAIQADRNSSVKDKLGTFKKTIEDTYGKEAPAMLKNRQQTYINQFVDAVQEDLAGMSSAQRSEALTEVRRGLGLDDAAISRWDDLDQQRDQRWSNGQIYMSERKEIMSRYSGSDREEKLTELRKKLFGEEADTIKSEENDGFFRFEKKRRYGRE